MYKFIKRRHDILIQCHWKYKEIKKINYKLGIEIFRNSTLSIWVTWGVLFKGLGVQKGTQTPCWLQPCSQGVLRMKGLIQGRVHKRRCLNRFLPKLPHFKPLILTAAKRCLTNLGKSCKQKHYWCFKKFLMKRFCCSEGWFLRIWVVKWCRDALLAMVLADIWKRCPNRVVIDFWVSKVWYKVRTTNEMNPIYIQILGSIKLLRNHTFAVQA